MEQKLDYRWYVDYHNRGDAAVEEKMIASLCRYFRLSRWDAFRLAYYYATTYHIPSALKLLRNPSTPKSELKFRTDRRYVRINGNYEKVMAALHPRMLSDLDKATTTTEQYNIVSSWYFFGRYASFLFLEVWAHINEKPVTDDLVMRWEEKENYTKGAELITGSTDRNVLTQFLESAKVDTNDNCFALETSLCAVEKIRKGTRWDGFYTERLLDEVRGNEWEGLILSLL